MPDNYKKFIEFYPNWREQLSSRLEVRGDHLLVMGSGKPSTKLNVALGDERRQIDLSRVVFYESNPDWNFRGTRRRGCAEVRCVNHTIFSIGGMKDANVYSVAFK